MRPIQPEIPLDNFGSFRHYNRFMTSWGILINVGNTCTTLALADCGRCGKPVRIRRTPTRGLSVASARDLLTRLVSGRNPVVAVAGSVVPGVNPVWIRTVRQVCGFELQWIGHDRPWNFSLGGYPRPATLGIDRLLNLCAACERYRPPLVVADFGTAVTVDLLDADGLFMGGMIAPGLAMVAGGLGRGTALLPEVPVKIGPRLPAVAGRGTRAAMRGGILRGYRGLAQALIRDAVAELGARTKVCVTGGYGAAIAAWLPGQRCRVHPHLTLEGMAAVARSIQGNGK